MLKLSEFCHNLNRSWVKMVGEKFHTWSFGKRYLADFTEREGQT